jgi:hypothetical protein
MNAPIGVRKGCCPDFWWSCLCVGPLHIGLRRRRRTAVVISVRYQCPEGCGCLTGSDKAGNYDADRLGCGCDGPCNDHNPRALI